MISHESLKNGPVSVNDDKYYYELFLDLYKPEQSFKKVMEKYGDYDDINTIKGMFYRGLKGEDKFRMFHLKLSFYIEEDSKAIFIEYLEKGLSVEDIINREDFWYDIGVVRKWYGLGYNGNSKHNEFYKTVSSILKSKHKEKITSYLDKGISLEAACLQEDICCTPKEFKKWSSDDSNYKTDKNKQSNKIAISNKPKHFTNQYELIKYYLENGLSLEEAINQNDVVWDLKRLKLYYNNAYKIYLQDFNYLMYNLHGRYEYYRKRARKAITYTELTSLLIENTKKNIINYFKMGLELDEILKKDDVFCVMHNFEKWYRNGFRGDMEHKKFYGEISALLDIKKIQNDIVKHLNAGVDLDEIFNNSFVFIPKEELVLWYNEGFNGNKKYKSFFKRISASLKPKNQKYLIRTVKDGRELGDLSYLNVICNIGEIKQWYLEDKNNPDNKLLFETVIQEEVFNIMRKEQVLFDYALENHSFDVGAKKIRQWYELGKAGKDYINFYNKIIELDETIKMDRTKKDVLNIIRKGVSLNDVLGNYTFDFPSNVIKDWYEKGKLGIAPHTYFAKEIDAFSKKEKPFKLNPGGFVR